MSKPAFSPGHVVAQRYRLVTRLGQGGMGDVWQAEHATLRAPVAIKLLDPDLLDPSRGVTQQEARSRFLVEAQAAAALRSPHVVQVLDHGIDEGVPYLVMELLEGETLGDRLDRTPIIPWEQTARILTHVARAVGKAHEAGILHRDLKPANIFLVRNDDEELAKVLDFGIAKLIRSPLDPQQAISVTRSGILVGTPCYMSPEQLQGTKEIDARSDLWAMAVIAFECVCGRRPFLSEAVGALVLEVCAKPLPVPSTIADVPPSFDAWWEKAACRDPAGRFQSARELAESLRLVLAPDLLTMSGVHHPLATSLVRSSSFPRRSGAPATPARTDAAMSSALVGRRAPRRALRTGALIASVGLGALCSGALALALWTRVSADPPAADGSGTAASPPSATPEPPPAASDAVTVTPAASASALPEPSAAPSASAPIEPVEPIEIDLDEPVAPTSSGATPVRRPRKPRDRLGF